jgi:integrase
MSGAVERVSLGRYPTVTLAKARELADKRRIAVAEGISPRAEQRRQRATERAAIAFDERVGRFLVERVAARIPKSLASVTSYLSRARDKWRSRAAKDITRDDVIAFLRDRAIGAPVAANRCRSALVTLFGWAVDEGYLSASPMVRIPKPATERAKDRVILDDEFPILWQAVDGLDPMFRRAFQVLALLGQRPGEISALTIGEVFDLSSPDRARIELGPDRTKNGRRHVIPLPDRARAIIAEAIAAKEEADRSPYVFASPRAAGRRDRPAQLLSRHVPADRSIET